MPPPPIYCDQLAQSITRLRGPTCSSSVMKAVPWASLISKWSMMNMPNHLQLSKPGQNSSLPKVVTRPFDRKRSSVGGWKMLMLLRTYCASECYTNVKTSGRRSPHFERSIGLSVDRRHKEGSRARRKSSCHSWRHIQHRNRSHLALVISPDPAHEDAHQRRHAAQAGQGQVGRPLADAE